MAATGNLFIDLPRSRPRRVLGHVVDAGNSCDPQAPHWARMRCRNGHTWEVISDSITELKRGIPCERCNP